MNTNLHRDLSKRIGLMITKAKTKIINRIKKISRSFGVELSKFDEFNRWQTLSEFLIIHIERTNLGSTTKDDDEFIKYIIKNYQKSRSQLFQDLLVSYLFKDKQNGFFVEFGATNGVSFSNSYLLEKEFKWKGILAEPGKTWHTELVANRDCQIDLRCVWDVSKEKISFNETLCAELSTVEEYTDVDQLAKARVNNKSYSVETVSLNDLLEQNDSPSVINFMSIDTEGTEFKILNQFNFEKYNVGVICVEHNFTELTRKNIYDLLLRNGFERVFTEYSNFDDWFVSRNLSDMMAL
jgi:FkbM family methyltransferase